MRVCSSGVAYGFVIVLVSAAAGSASTLLGWSAEMTTTIVAVLLLARFAVSTPDKVATIAVSTAMSLGWTYAFTAKFVLQMPLATTRFYGAQLESFPFNAIIIVFFATILAYPAAFVVSFLRRATLPVAIAITVVTAVFAALGLRSLARPAPDDYATLFTTTRINPGGEAVAGDVTVRYGLAPATAGVDRHCVASANGAEIATPTMLLDCSPLTIRSDARTDAVVVFSDERRPPIAMFRMNGDKLDAVGIDDLRGRLGAPRGWVFAALASIAVACAAIAMALRIRRPIRGVEGQHEGAGWFRVGGVPRFAGELASNAVGPVVVLEGANAAPTYRDDGAAKLFTVKHGTLASLHDEQRARVASWACVAVAASVIGIVPLWIAHVHGLL